MKNRRMKLTALAMSVLMAMSTITSVTWAADLFTDGAPAEVAVETPVDVVSDVEEQIAADDAALMGDLAVTSDKLDSVVFKYEPKDSDFRTAKKVVAEFTFNNDADQEDPDNDTPPWTITRKVDATPYRTTIKQDCSTPEVAIYVAEVKVQSGTVTVYSDDPKVTGEAGTVSASVFVGPDGTAYTIPGNTGQIVVPGTVPKGHVPNARVKYTIDSGNHKDPGKGVYYNECAVCHKVLPNGTVTGSFAANLQLPEDFFTGYEQQVAGPRRITDAYGRDYDVEFYDIDVTKHNYNEASPVIVYGIYEDGDEDRDGIRNELIGGPLFDYRGFRVENYAGFVNVTDFAPYNCHMENGKMVADDPGSPQDAYYYTVVKCRDCNTIKYWDKVYLKNAQGSVRGTYYERVDDGNIIGFFGKNRTLEYYFDNRNNSNSIANGFVPDNNGFWKIPVGVVSDDPEPIFDKCNAKGYYDVKTYVTDNPEATSSKRVEVPINHSWGPIELVLQGTTFMDGSTSATENGELYSVLDRNGNRVYDVVRDSNGNVTDVKTINCITTAKYQLGRQCIICKKWIKDGDLKTAGPNKDRHTWGEWSNGTDPADDKYYDIGDGTHRRFTYVHRTCTLCKERDLKLKDEFVEAHKLVETKYDDDSEDGVDETYVAPTCGKPGSYDVILRCACGFEDAESRKTTTILPTDQHDFGDNPAELQIIGDIQVGRGQQALAGAPAAAENPENKVYAIVVRKCTICGEYDANGINNTPAVEGEVGASNLVIDTPVEGRTFSDYVPAKADPTTHVPYPCSVGQITVNFKWEGKVDGKATRLTGSKTVPYYINELAYQGARAHEPGEAVIENKVDATADTAGSYDKVLYCRVCGDEISRETITVKPEEIIPVPTAKATPVNYNTINITWNAVEGATSYNVYYRSAALGVNDWTLAKSVTGTSFDYSGLITGVKYRFTVSAVKGENSSEFGVNTSVAAPKLAAPEVKTVTAVKKGTKVTWTKVDGANGYIIQSKTASGKWTRVGTVKKGAKVSWIDKKAVSGTTYRVRAYRTVDAPNISKNNVYGPFSAAK